MKPRKRGKNRRGKKVGSMVGGVSGREPAVHEGKGGNIFSNVKMA